jgi:putative Mn2+ efflux pump MntP
MSFVSIILLAIGLGMDVLSVAVGAGTALRGNAAGPILRLSLSFGGFQFAMPIAGWLAGRTVAELISRFDHWLAFLILAYIGGNMIRGAFREGSSGKAVDPTRGFRLLLLSVATSIDALAVGLSLALLNVPILYPSAVIGVTSFGMAAAGMLFGGRLGRRFGKRVEAIGGVILIGIGIKILCEHLL